MKKIFCIFMAIALCLCIFSGCGGPSPGVDYVSFDTLFVRVANYDDCSVYRHKDTNVLYVYMGSAMSVLLNADGTPMVWSGH